MEQSLDSQTPEAPGQKRKSEDGPGSSRTKRKRYISIACNECKRRKIKCNGNTTCQRCEHLNLECVYAPNCCGGSNFRDSEEYRAMHAQITSLQEHVDILYANLNSFRSDLAAVHTPIDPSLQNNTYMSHPTEAPAAQMLSPSQTRPKSQSAPKPPTFRGPTSNDFSFDVARSSLQRMGINPSGQSADNGPFATDDSPSASPGAEARPHASKDPIWFIQRDEALRLLRVYDEQMADLYPVVSVPHLTARVNILFNFMEAATRQGIVYKSMPGADAIEDEDTNTLKLVLAIAMSCEGQGKSELGQRMFEYVQPAVDGLLLGNAGIGHVRMLALAAMYEFHRDNEGTSWRVIGLTARLCIELGLHRRETYDLMAEDERDSTILLFWAIYSLDRRWSFGTGMPFALQDADIDPALPKPGDRSPYLMAMIDYCAIGSRVWRTVGSENMATASGEGITKEDIGYLDYQIIQWHRTLPESLRYNHPDQLYHEREPPFSADYRLRLILYLRANSMRIHLYRPVLHSASSIVSSRTQAQTVVDVAKDTIRILTHLTQTSSIYRTSQALFNPFLTSALAVLFLAVSHTPALFAEQVREEFYMALDLIRGFSRGSWISKRLWKTIRVLKEVGPKLGLVTRDSRGTMDNRQRTDKEDSSRSAALAMAGLAGHNVDELALYQQGVGGQAGPPQPRQWHMAGTSLASGSPDHMANDLTSLFEAAGGYSGEGTGYGASGLHVGANGSGSSNGPAPYPMGTPAAITPGGEGMVFGSEDELSKIMRDLF